MFHIITLHLIQWFPNWGLGPPCGGVEPVQWGADDQGRNKEWNKVKWVWFMYFTSDCPFSSVVPHIVYITHIYITCKTLLLMHLWVLYLLCTGIHHTSPFQKNLNYQDVFLAMDGIIPKFLSRNYKMMAVCIRSMMRALPLQRCVM